jgi:hypothetical protein
MQIIDNAITELHDRPSHYLPPGDLDNLLATIQAQKQTINLLIDALSEASESLLDSASECEDSDSHLGVVRAITKVLAQVSKL